VDAEQTRDLAARVKNARERLGMEELARRARLSPITLRRIEDGEPVRSSSLVKARGALDDAGSAPVRRVARTTTPDLSAIDDDALLDEVRRRMQDHRPVDRW
jgi:transcriptional regulator with XRE-family HTH domain